MEQERAVSDITQDHIQALYDAFALCRRLATSCFDGR